MAEATSYIGVTPRTAILTNAAVGRGLRITRDSTGSCAVAPAATKGEYVTMVDGDALKPVMVQAMGNGGKVPAVASEACAVGDQAYAAANGKFSKTSTNAALCGRWTLAASADGVLGEVELTDIA